MAWVGMLFVSFIHDYYQLERQRAGQAGQKISGQTLVRANKVDLLHLREAKIHCNIDSVIRNIKGSRRCGREWVLQEGASGGLIVIWNEDTLEKQAVFKSQRASNLKECTINFLSKSDDFRWVVANTYGPNEETERSAFQDLLSFFLSRWLIPWCFGGDFNMVRFSYEKKKGVYFDDMQYGKVFRIY